MGTALESRFPQCCADSAANKKACDERGAKLVDSSQLRVERSSVHGDRVAGPLPFSPSGAPPDVSSEQLVDERLIPDSRARRLHAQCSQDVRVDANRDQLAGRTAERRPADSPRARQLIVGQFRNVRKVNLLDVRTPPFLCGSPPAR